MSTSDSLAEEIAVEAQHQSNQNETRKDVNYKTKEIRFHGRKKQIILQNENGPCPLIAICNVLLLRDDMNPYPHFLQVSQERLLTLVANTLIEFNSNVDSENEEFIEQKQNISDAIDLLPCLADGINVNIKFRRIDDFEFTPELAIFDLLKIPLYHGWIVNHQDLETAAAIGCKSYNALMSELVALETHTVKSRSGQSSGECSVDFAAVTTAALGIPSPCRWKTRCFADSRPASAEHSRLRKGDVEEELALLQALQLSEREALGFDIHRDSSSGKESVSGFSDENEMSDCTSTPGSNICKQSQSDDQFSSTKSKDDCDVGDKINVGEEVCSTTSITKSTGGLDHDQLSSTEWRDETVCDVETENSSKMTTVHVTSSEVISAEKTNLESTKIDSSPEVPLKSEGVTSVNPDFSDRSQDNDDEPPYEGEECVSLGSPVYEGESLLGKNSLEGSDTDGLTPEEGELINNFLNNNRTQLTVTGLSYLQKEVKEDELCVFFRNNHFLTMLKYDSQLYQLVTDQGYLTQRDLVWEKLNKVNGDSVFMTGDFKLFKSNKGKSFKVFKSDEGKSRKWDQENAISNTADYMYSVNSSSKEGAFDPDLNMAMALQQQELAGDTVSEVSIRSNQRPSSIQEVKVVQRRQMYNHVYKPSSCPLTTSLCISFPFSFLIFFVFCQIFHT